MCGLTTVALGQPEPQPPPEPLPAAPDTTAPTPVPTAPPEPQPAPTPAPAPVAPPPAPVPPVAPPPPPIFVPAPPAPDPSAKHHDGFYFRWGLGPGYLTDSIDSSEVGKAELRGFGVVSELLLGGTPAPGLVIGGGTHGASIFGPTLEIEDSNGEAPDLLGLSLLGAFVDYYFDPHGGWHAQVFLGLAALTADDSDFDENPGGFGVALGGGHEWWVSNQLSLGVLARVIYAPLRYDRRGIEETHVVFVPGLLGTLTYH